LRAPTLRRASVLGSGDLGLGTGLSFGAGCVNINTSLRPAGQATFPLQESTIRRQPRSTAAAPSGPPHVAAAVIMFTCPAKLCLRMLLAPPSLGARSAQATAATISASRARSSARNNERPAAMVTTGSTHPSLSIQMGAARLAGRRHRQRHTHRPDSAGGRPHRGPVRAEDGNGWVTCA